VVAIIGAIAQDDVKRLLSFTLVSHIGYMIYGVAVGNQIGLSAAVFYVAHHIVVQTALFLVVGLVEAHTGTTSLASLGGVATTAPVVGILFFVPAMNLAGIPPFSGFLGKVGLLQAGVAAGTATAYVLVAGSLVTSLLTLYAVSRVWSRAFWRSPGGDAAADAEADTPISTQPHRIVAGGRGAGSATTFRSPVSRGMLWPAAFLVIVSTSITVVAGPLYTVTDAAAREASARTPYVSAVFPAGVP
jgi:multicomponent Na+:H+ antiporter subunit D